MKDGRFKLTRYISCNAPRTTSSFTELSLANANVRWEGALLRPASVIWSNCSKSFVRSRCPTSDRSATPRRSVAGRSFAVRPFKFISTTQHAHAAKYDDLLPVRLSLHPSAYCHCRAPTDFPLNMSVNKPLFAYHVDITKKRVAVDHPNVRIGILKKVSSFFAVIFLLVRQSIFDFGNETSSFPSSSFGLSCTCRPLSVEG